MKPYLLQNDPQELKCPLKRNQHSILNHLLINNLLKKKSENFVTFNW